MKVFSRIMAAVFILVWIGIVFCYVYIRLNGRHLIVSSLEQIFEKPVKLEKVTFLFPLGVRISNLQVEHVFSVQDVHLQFGFPDFLSHRIRLLLLSLSEPSVMVLRDAESRLALGDRATPPSSSSTSTGHDAEKKTGSKDRAKHPRPLKVIVDYLLIEKGRLRFTDLSRGKKFQMDLQDVDVKGQNVAFPKYSTKTKIDATAKLFKQGLALSGSRVNLQGWADFFNKNMQTHVEVVDPDGKVGLSAQVDSKDNEMTIDGKIHISNLISEKTDPPETQNSLKDLVLASLQSSGVEIIADFHAQTKMDNIQFDTLSFSGNLGYKTDAYPQTGVDATTEQDVKSIGEHFEALGKKFYKETIEDQLNQEVSPAK